MQVKTHPTDSFVLRSPVYFQFQSLVKSYPDNDPTCDFSLQLWHSFCRSPHPPTPLAPQLPRVQRASQRNQVTSPFILTVGELGPADCFLHPLQFWQRLSASEMKEQRESSSKRSESSNENLSPSSHSANMSSITSDRRRGGKTIKTETALLTFNRWMDLRAPAVLKTSILIRSPYYSARKNKASAIWGGRSRKSNEGKLVKILGKKTKTNKNQKNPQKNKTRVL